MATEKSTVTNLPGVYRHPGSRARLTIMPDFTSNGSLITSQADALVRMGFERIGDAPTGVQLRKQQQDQADRDAKAEAAGVVADPYLVPGTQETVYNGTAHDKGGQGDREAALVKENESLQQQLAEAQANGGVPSDEVVDDEETNNKEGN